MVKLINASVRDSFFVFRFFFFYKDPPRDFTSAHFRFFFSLTWISNFSVECQPIAGCSGAVNCTNSNDSKCGACLTGTYLISNVNSSDVCGGTFFFFFFWNHPCLRKARIRLIFCQLVLLFRAVHRASNVLQTLPQLASFVLSVSGSTLRNQSMNASVSITCSSVYPPGFESVWVPSFLRTSFFLTISFRMLSSRGLYFDDKLQ